VYGPLSDIWDRGFSRGAWTLTIDFLIICGNELAIVVSNEGEVEGATVVVRSIETYRFADDGSLHIRT